MSRLDEAVAAAEKIKGWMETEELRWLGEQAAEHHTIVEVGSWQGRSTKVMALMTPGTVWSVDDLTGEADDPVENLNAKFCKNVEDEIAHGKVRIVRTTSLEAIPFVKAADMVFIDGCHEHPAPQQDIEAWRAILSEGGLLCGHDADYPGVAQALESLHHDRPVGSIWVAR